MFTYLILMFLTIISVFQPLLCSSDHGVQCSTKNSKDRNDLRVHEAISRNDPEVLRNLSESVTLDKDEGNMLLKRSIMRGWTNSISWLVKEGADPNAKDSKGNTPLHVAAMMDCASCIDAIMTSTAKVDLEAKNSIVYTPLWLAARQDNLNAIMALAAYGADLNTRFREDISSISEQTPLTFAAWRGAAATVAVLLKAGADPNSLSSGGNNAICLAAKYGKMEAVKILLQHGIDLKYKNKRSPNSAEECAGGHRDIASEIRRWTP